MSEDILTCPICNTYLTRDKLKSHYAEHGIDIDKLNMTMPDALKVGGLIAVRIAAQWTDNELHLALPFLIAAITTKYVLRGVDVDIALQSLFTAAKSLIKVK